MKKLSFILPLLIISGLMINCWIWIFTNEIVATWRHYAGLLLFAVLITMVIRRYKMTLLFIGIFLIAATFNLLAMTPSISTSWLTIGPVSTPPIQLLSFGIFILYAIMNTDELIKLYWDIQERKGNI
jgi:hypothetical protein